MLWDISELPKHPFIDCYLNAGIWLWIHLVEWSNGALPRSSFFFTKLPIFASSLFGAASLWDYPPKILVVVWNSLVLYTFLVGELKNPFSLGASPLKMLLVDPNFWFIFLLLAFVVAQLSVCCWWDNGLQDDWNARLFFDSLKLWLWLLASA